MASFSVGDNSRAGFVLKTTTALSPNQHSRQSGERDKEAYAAPPVGMLRGSLDVNALSGDIPCNFRDEIARRVIDIQFERTGLPVAVLSQTDRLTQVNRPHKISVGVITPHAVGQLDGAARGLYPGAEANVVSARVYIRIMHFRPAKVPVLESFLDRLPAYAELDVPQSND